MSNHHFLFYSDLLFFGILFLIFSLHWNLKMNDQ